MDDLLRDSKEKFILEGQKAYIAINGAGGAALLAFLQAIWAIKDARALTIGALWGVAVLAWPLVPQRTRYVTWRLPEGNTLQQVACTVSLTGIFLLALSSALCSA
jgi:hypothetical protein